MAVTAAIWEILITSSALIAGIFCIRKLTLGKISMRLRYGLWILAVVRLLVPVSVGASPVSVMNLFSRIPQEKRADGLSPADGRERPALQTGPLPAVSETGEKPARVWKEEEAGTTDAVYGMQEPQEKLSGTWAEEIAAFFKKITPMQAAGAVWLAGCFITGGGMLYFRFRFAGYLRRKRRALPEEEIPMRIRGKLAARGLRVYRVKGLPSPCLVGRGIYLGEQTPGKERELTHILAHEYCHRMHGDGFWSFVRCALAAVYWFDPLVWAAAYAARQDSDLACDEAVVRLLGEEERFAYGKTLLALLQESESGTKRLGISHMYSGSEPGFRERIVALTGKNEAQAVVLAAVFSLVFLICGCAFTGAQVQTGEAEDSGEVDGQGEETVFATQEGQTILEGGGEEFARIRKEYGESVEAGELTEEQIRELEEKAIQEAQRSAFEETLNYHGAMEGRDDGELSLNREMSKGHYVEYGEGKREAPEEGWYLLCRAEEEDISFYGLFTEEFGCRGVKTLIGEDVNTFDLVWDPCAFSHDGKNIRVLERAQDGLPRRFVWKYVEEDSSDTEIWRLASGYRYDTGTVELEVLPEKEYLPWADWHLTYGIDQEKGQVRVYYDGSENALAGILDISAYGDFQVEGVKISRTFVSFDLNSEIYEEDADENYEGIVIHLVPGLQLEGSEELWSWGLSPIAVQLIWNEEEEEFRMGRPKVDEQYQTTTVMLERNLEKLQEGLK